MNKGAKVFGNGRSSRSGTRLERVGDPMTTTTNVDGSVAPGFEEVRAEFERNFAERGEIGAAVAAYWRGEKVVDLWGGRRTPEGDAPWNEDTMVVVMSITKGLVGDDAGGGERARLARLRRAGRALLARVRAERQGRDHGAPAPRPRGGAGPARRGAARSRSCATSTTSRACSRARSRRGRRGRVTATTR